MGGKDRQIDRYSNRYIDKERAGGRQTVNR